MKVRGEEKSKREKKKQEKGQRAKGREDIGDAHTHSNTHQDSLTY